MKTERFASDALGRNDFLGGRVRLWQPLDGYRAGIDPVLLAATIPAKPGETVLELGCGAAPGLCCLGGRVPDLMLTGLELQPAYADLARRNLAENDLQGAIIEGDVADPPPLLRGQSFHHVLANPPYFESESRNKAQDTGREVALAGETPLSRWVETAARRTRPGGTVTFIQRAERLPVMLSAMQSCLGSLELWPLLPREGRAPRLILLRGRKAGRAQFRFHPGLVLHQGARHERDTDHYTDRVSIVLREGAVLPFPT